MMRCRHVTYRVSSPAAGMAMHALMPMHSRSMPSRSASMARCCFTAGIIITHVEKAKPLMKKALFAAMISLGPA